MSNKKQNSLIEYLEKNYSPGKTRWAYVAEKFGYESPETVRNIWKRHRKAKGVTFNDYANLVDGYGKLEDEVFVNDKRTGSASIKKSVEKDISGEEELIKECKIDTSKWDIIRYKSSKYFVPFKDKDGNMSSKPMFALSADLKPKTIANTPSIFVEELVKALKAESPVYKNPKFTGNVKGTKLLELDVFDLHLGKLAWKAEVGEDYDIAESVKRYILAIDYLISTADLKYVKQILLPIGNDMLNVDSRLNMTTAGTPQDCDGRYAKMFKILKDLLISTIDKLVKIAPVNVIVVPGNHDNQSMLALGFVLEAWYHNNSAVFINNVPTQRKYFKFGKCGLMFTHGNEEKHQDLGLIFATENPTLWASTLFREVHLGHYHKTKRVEYVSVDENQGFKIRIIGSLSGQDFYHNRKGYNSLKAAEAFLWDSERGLVASYPYTYVPR
jgi:hypothetical protein